MRVAFDARFFDAGGWHKTMLDAALALLRPYGIDDLKLRIVTVEPVDSPHKTRADIVFGVLTNAQPDITLTVEGSDHDIHELVRRCSAATVRSTQ